MKYKPVTIGTVVAITVLSATAAVATQSSGLRSEPLVRGAAGEFRISDHDMKFRLSARESTDVALVKATLDAGGSTGWHTHPGQSLVIVKTGTMTTYEQHHRRCVSETIQPGQAFVHPEGAHNFVNNTSGPVEFYVAYFVPAGAAPLLNDAAAPAACSKPTQHVK